MRLFASTCVWRDIASEVVNMSRIMDTLDMTIVLRRRSRCFRMTEICCRGVENVPPIGLEVFSQTNHSRVVVKGKSTGRFQPSSLVQLDGRVGKLTCRA